MTFFRLDLPAEFSSVGDTVTQQRCLMHQLLRNATDVHARPAQTPAGSQRRRSNEIQNGNLNKNLHKLTKAHKNVSGRKVYVRYRNR